MKISILTPCLNAGPYLERAIRSVLTQDDPDFEHIVVDGGSTDDTVRILQKYPGLKWISEPDQGQSDAMNKAFAMSTGDVLTYLNADDWFEPGAFAHVRQLLSVHPEAEMVVGNLYLRYEDREIVGLTVPIKNYRGILLYFRYRFPLNPVSYFYRREVQTRVGQFPLRLQYGMDYWFLLRAFSTSRICSTDMVLGTFFQTGTNKTCHSSPTDTPWEIVTQHLREDDPKMRLFFYSHWCWNRYVRELPERVKAPFRRLAHKLLFASTVSPEEFKRLGFRKCWRTHVRKR
jgi:glycosyltransferase involved in cell wall biosynthesis